MTPYIYIFARTDLSAAQQIIQAAHAVQGLGLNTPRGHTSHMVLIGAKDQNDLVDRALELDALNIDYHMFYEPDVNEYTAIATHPLRGKERTPLRKFNLLK